MRRIDDPDEVRHDLIVRQVSGRFVPEELHQERALGISRGMAQAIGNVVAHVGGRLNRAPRAYLNGVRTRR